MIHLARQDGIVNACFNCYSCFRRIGSKGSEQSSDDANHVNRTDAGYKADADGECIPYYQIPESCSMKISDGDLGRSITFIGEGILTSFVSVKTPDAQRHSQINGISLLLR